MLTILFCLIITFSLNGCFVLVPFVHPDYKTRGAPVARAADADIPAAAVCPFTGPSRGAMKRPVPANRGEKLVKELSHPEAVVRTHAAFWLGEMGTEAHSAVPNLINCLSDESNWVRRACAKALGKIGSSSAVKPLTKTLKDSDKYVAHSAANALKKIGTKDARLALSSYRGV